MSQGREGEVDRQTEERGEEVEKEKGWCQGGMSLPSLESFDGKQDWGDFKGQLERHMRARGWREQDMPDILAMHLKGDALHFFGQLPAEVRSSFSRVMQFMTTRFVKGRSLESARSLFLGASQVENESLRDFAGRLRSLAIEAFPGLPMDYVEGEMIRRFQDGCVYRDLTLLTCAVSHKTLEEVVVSMEMLSEKQKSLGLKKIRAV